MEINVNDVMEAVDGRPAIVQCFKSGQTACTQFETCTIRNPLELVQQRMAMVLNETTLYDLVLSTMETHQVAPIGTFHTHITGVGGEA
jgi:DNA-binding IscR family transcriptional regulator